MSEPTKACNLTKYEIKGIISMRAETIIECIKRDDLFEEGIERINYLNRRLKSFNEVEIISERTATVEPTSDSKAGW